MAKLNGPLDFKGKLGGISAFKMKGVKGTVVREPGGPSREDIKTKSSCDIVRRNNFEFGGCSRAGKYLRGASNP
jgi:hypothetical protein